MRDEFVITRQGKQYALYQGILDEAHARGLKGIDTDLVQVPTAENGQVAVVKATVEMEDGRTFSGIGDASPENVGRGIVPHIIRMAETRAKARALRDAVNVGVASLEELSDGADVPSPTVARRPNGGRSAGRQGREARSRRSRTSRPTEPLRKAAGEPPGREGARTRTPGNPRSTSSRPSPRSFGAKPGLPAWRNASGNPSPSSPEQKPKSGSSGSPPPSKEGPRAEGRRQPHRLSN